MKKYHEDVKNYKEVEEVEEVKEGGGCCTCF